MTTPLVDRAMSVLSHAHQECAGSPGDMANALVHAIALFAAHQPSPRYALAMSIERLQQLLENMPEQVAGKMS